MGLEDKVIVMDNHRAHWANDVREYIEERGGTLEFMPPSSSYFNSIKTAWAWMAANRSLGAARGAWVASDRRPFAEQADPAHRLVWRGRPDPLDGGLADFEAVCAMVLEPLFDHLDAGVET